MLLFFRRDFGRFFFKCWKEVSVRKKRHESDSGFSHRSLQVFFGDLNPRIDHFHGFFLFGHLDIFSFFIGKPTI